jgi:Glutaredoxin-like domain (DUF836)
MPHPESRGTGRIRVYSRPGCHLCELLIDELLPLIRGRLDLEVIDIETRPELTIKYGIRIPVVEYAGQTVCQYHLDAAAIHTILNALPGS